MSASPIPPLNALRVFLAAARHSSFSRAAVELNVTHGAVSRQVRHLEEFLGVALFERQVRKVSLTAEGQQLFAETGPALDQIGKAARAVMARPPGHAVRINARPSFSVRWLIPRLPHFTEAAHHAIEVRMITSIRPVDFVVTELAVIGFPNGEATLLETGPGVSVADVVAATDAILVIPADVPPMLL